jgi:predicted lipoprotein with Yx(FWY)xxD motif
MGSPGRPAVSTVTLLAAAGAGLLAATGAIHLDLYLTGYSSVATIGLLFLAQVAAAFLLALAVVVVRHPLVLAAGALFALGTLAGYLVSVAVGLFGFREVRTTAGIVAGVVEISAFVVLGLAGALALDPARRRMAMRGVAPLTLASALALGLVLAGSSAAPAQPAPARAAAPIVAMTVPHYGVVLGNAHHDSLYLLTAERGDRIVCTGGCLALWPPLLATAAFLGRKVPGLAGRLGLVRRGPHVEQVTYDGYPLYTYAGDPGPRASAGEGIASFGGTWYLVRAAATTPSAAAVTAPS